MNIRCRLPAPSLWSSVLERCTLFSLVLTAGMVQAASPITPSGSNTQVNEPLTLPGGQTQYNITGGTRPGGGVNLFHSFGEFGVPANTATFS